MTDSAQTWVFMDAWYRIKNMVADQLANTEKEVEALGLPDLAMAVATIREDLAKADCYVKNGEGFIDRGGR